MGTQSGKQINYTGDLSSAILQQILQGSGDSTTTTTGGGLSPEQIAAIMATAGGIGGNLAMPDAVSAPTVPGVAATVTPEQLAALFVEGAKQVPNLTAAFANASGGRSANNSGLELALNSLNQDIVQQAAKLNQGQQQLSTDAAFKGGTLANQASEINARNWQAFVQAQTQLELARAQMEASAIGANKQPQTQQTVKDKGVSPWALLGGGMVLNAADKGNWWERIGNKFKGAFDSNSDTSAVSDVADSITLPTQDTSLLGSNFTWTPNDVAPNAFMPEQWAMPGNFSFDLPTMQMPELNFGSDFQYTMPDFNGIDYPSIDLGNFNFDLGDWGNIDTSTFGLDVGSTYEDAGSFDYNDLLNWEFKDGGMPMRKMTKVKFADGGSPQRNRANMGAAPVRTVSGVQNRELPVEYRGLVAPINLQPLRDQNAAIAQAMAAMQEREAQMQAAIEAAAARREQQQREQQLQQTVRTGNVDEISLREGSNDSMENNTNMAFSPGVANFATGALGIGGLIASLAGAPGIAAGLGTTRALASAENNDEAVAAGALGGIRIANPLLGFIAQQINNIREARAAAAQQAAVEAAAQQAQQAGNDYGADTPNGITQADTSQEVGVNYVNNPDAVWNDEFGFGQDASSANFSDRGPGGSSGESGAAAGGASARGPGDGSGGDAGGDGGDSGGSSGGDSSSRNGLKDGGSPARGGMVRGPGTGTSDSIKTPMAAISNGEYIVSADVVKAMGGPQFFDKLQAAFHSGGKPA